MIQKLGKEFIPFLNRKVDQNVLVSFRAFFAFHLFLQSLKLPWSYGHNLIVYLLQGSILLCVVAMFFERASRAGVLFLAAYKLYWVYIKFPSTANHYYFEFLVLVLLFIFHPIKEEKRENYLVDGTAIRLIQIGILSVYFYGGVHKLVHGFWLDGEFLIQTLFKQGNGGLGKTLGLFINFFDPHWIKGPLSLAKGLEVTSFKISSLSLNMITVLSLGTIFTEIFTPLLFVFKKTRKWGFIFMIILQIIIGFSAWETEFMFAALGSIFLFTQKGHPRTFMFLGLIHALWAIFIIYILDLRIGIL
mgnify:CR=1 FL=1